MRMIVNYLIIFLVLLGQKTEAATTPLLPSFVQPPIDTSFYKSNILPPSSYVPHKKVGFIKKLQYKILQKKLKYLSNKFDEGTQSKTNVLSIISLALGLITVIGVVASVGVITLIAAPLAVITGIIALNNKSNSKGSKAMARIGLILGSLLILLLIIALIAYSDN